MSFFNRVFVSVLGVFVAACATEREPTSYTTTWLPDTGADTEGDDDGGGERFDVAQGDGTDGNGGDNESDSCKKVDLLFVIDNSGSMADEQSNLISSFPGFIESIQTQLADTKGYHVGITTSDVYYGNFNDPGCSQLGVLVTQTAGLDASNAICGPYAAGTNYMTEADDLAAAFQCAARVGTSGDGNERPMDALQAAVSPMMNAQGSCNEGFVRDDALLVVVLITDEEDDHEASACANNPGSVGEPQQWFDSLVALKGGVESNVVVLSLVGPAGQQACPALDKCGNAIDGAELAARIIEFTEKFTYGFVGRVCESSYDSFFQEAVGVIESACDDFMPQG